MPEAEFPSRCDETLRLVEFGESNIPAPDEVITYAILSDIAGENVQSPKGRGHLNTFRRHMFREHNVVFEVIRTVGLRRIVNGDQIPITQRGLLKASRGIKRTSKVLNSTVENELPKSTRVDFWALKRHLGIMREIADPRQYLRVRKDVQEAKPKTAGEVDQIVRNRVLDEFARGALRSPKKA